MEIAKQYSSSETEKRWYEHWNSKGYFKSTPDEREAFTIVIPPPNVTGVLHMGHLLNNTIQDILIRKARKEGKNACWVPGTDHASIATEAKVVKMLRERGIKKSDITREEFLKYAFEWKDKYGGIILNQLQLLGCSCDWDRTRFTMEPKLSAAVVKVFVDLFRKGLMYRGKRMTNWDPEALTVLSNEEVIYGEEKLNMYYVKYAIEGSDNEFITIATVRPETIMGDTAVCVHPNDERYKHLHGKRCIVPVVNRSVPIITDTYIDMEFGTGCLKVTPAHDPNDYEIGTKHGLEVIDVFNDDGTMSKEAEVFVGEERFSVRKKMKKILEESGALVKVEEYMTRVGRSERTSAVIEPRLTLQWFLKMDDFAAKALKVVEDGEIRFFPDNFVNMYRSWLSNPRDWCVSRQLWWGQQIPAFYTPDGSFAVAMTKEEAFEMLKKEQPNLSIEDLRQDEDVMDTWFSSMLWPISVFDGFESDEELKYYYPTNVLVTGWDIMFFWVARMIMAGYEWQGQRPFKDVYFTGMVRDQLRRKMSKSLGNSPDAIELLARYGADGVRFGLLSSSPAGGDLVFDAPFDKVTKEILNESQLCEQGRNFCNKLWNAMRLIKGWEIDENAKTDAPAALAIKWMEQAITRTMQEVETLIAEYRLSEALRTLYALIWDDFCAWYLEMVKPEYQKPIDRATYEASIAFFEDLMSWLHPFMPFVTEEIWSKLRDRSAGDDCMMAQLKKGGSYDKDFLFEIGVLKDLVGKVREVRNNNQLKPKELLDVYTKDTASARKFLESEGFSETIKKMAFLKTLDFQNDTQGVAFVAGTEQYVVVFEKETDPVAERQKLEKELEHAQRFVDTTRAKLSNERFVQNAKPEVIAAEQKKLADGEARLKAILESLGN